MYIKIYIMNYIMSHNTLSFISLKHNQLFLPVFSLHVPLCTFLCITIYTKPIASSPIVMQMLHFLVIERIQVLSFKLGK